MKKVQLDYVADCTEDGAELVLTVQGKRVHAYFPAHPNTQIYDRVKQILTSSYLNILSNSGNFLTE